MKNILTIIICILAISANAQTPTTFPFQGHLVDNAQEPIANRSVDLNIWITQDEQGTIIDYSESHNVQTDENGLFNIQIGTGSNASGDFDMIDWLQNQGFVGIEYNLNDGQGFQLLGYDFLHAVPFALHAKYIISCVNGLVGEDGMQGPQGQQGVQGAAGSNGADGLPGLDGQSGPTGVSEMSIDSVVPSPAITGTVYLDDGTNREDNLPGFRFFDGTNWIDL